VIVVNDSPSFRFSDSPEHLPLNQLPKWQRSSSTQALGDSEPAWRHTVSDTVDGFPFWKTGSGKIIAEAMCYSSNEVSAPFPAGSL